MDVVLILLLASLPFAAKAATLWLGLTGYFAQSAYKVLQLAIPLGWRFFRRKQGCSVAIPTQRRFPFVRWLNLGVLLAFVFAGSAIAAILFLGPSFGLHREVLRKAFDTRFDVSPAAAVAVVLFLSSANAALEELHFRVWLDRELTKRLGNILGVGISALAFGSMHAFILVGLPGIRPEAIVAMGAGLTLAGTCWSILLRRAGGVYAAWLSHGLTDVILLTWGLFWLGYL